MSVMQWEFKYNSYYADGDGGWYQIEDPQYLYEEPRSDW